MEYDKVKCYHTVYESPIGFLYLVFCSDRLVGITLEKPHLRVDSPPPGVIHQIAAYFDGANKDFDITVDVSMGTQFEQKVWLALREIPFGETRSYKWLAEHLGTPKGSRAVGQALAKNPIPIVLPCHRVIESGGKMGGYSLGGVEVKRRLLALEYYC